MQLVCSAVLKYCLRGMLGDRRWETLFYFLDSIAMCCAECVTVSEVGKLEERMHTAIVLMERDIPMTIQVMALFSQNCTLWNLVPNYYMGTCNWHNTEGLNLISPQMLTICLGTLLKCAFKNLGHMLVLNAWFYLHFYVFQAISSIYLWFGPLVLSFQL